MPGREPHPNRRRIYDTVRRIPRGRVATYGQVAELAGLAGHARQVGYALNGLPEGSDVPWHRVLNAQGRISLGGGRGFGEVQRKLLEREGVRFDRAGRVDLAVYRWKPRTVAGKPSAKPRTAAKPAAKRAAGKTGAVKRGAGKVLVAALAAGTVALWGLGMARTAAADPPPPVPAVDRADLPRPDRSYLEERRAVNPEAKPPATLLPGTPQIPRVLLAGDSWAQYMWDDGSHNDVFDRFGQADKRAVSLSLGSDPGPGYTGPEYAVSGSEARQWVDTANYPWMANMVAALTANPTIDLVMLSIGGNDVLAGKPDGGWYKDMDLDVPGSEAALFQRIHDDTDTIIDAALAVRPDLDVLLSSYDYPNFNVGFWCFVYACPKRRDLSRDPTNDLITDQEINQMMITVETQRMAWTNARPRVLYDNAVGLMHWFYGDGVSAAFTLPKPGQTPPDYLPFPGGNPDRPTLRSNFRVPNGIDADPIHLNYAAYQRKIAVQTETTFFPRFRGEPTGTFFAAGGAADGWTDGTATGTDGLRLGDHGALRYTSVVTFDTGDIPDGSTVTAASVYLQRSGASGTNPFNTATFGVPRVDVATGTFGAAAVEPGDATAPGDAADCGQAIGSARANGYAVRVDLDAAGLAAINQGGLTQIRIAFPATDGDTLSDYTSFADGDGGAIGTDGVPGLAALFGTTAPFLDVTWTPPSTGVPGPATVSALPRLLPAAPNPATAGTRLRFSLPQDAPVRLAIYDVSGREVAVPAAGRFPAGEHAVAFDGRGADGAPLPAGVYLVRFAALGRVSTSRLVWLAR